MEIEREREEVCEKKEKERERRVWRGKLTIPQRKKEK